MKKTLIAVAAAALSMGAMAQNVTLSGKFAVGYGKSIGGQSNLGVTDGDVKFSASEDLGGGLKASTAMEVQVRGRKKDNTTINGRNATIGLSGGFGSITLGAVDASNGIVGLGFAGAPVSLATGYDGAILSGGANVDWLNYTTPALIPGLTAKIERIDSITEPSMNALRGTSANVLGANYSAGAIAAAADYTDYSTGQTRIRISGSYNIGIAKLGVGFEDNKKGANTTGTQTAFGVTVPLGAVSAGLIFARSDEGTAKKQGWGVGMNYSLSKRTTFNASYGDVTRGASAPDGAQYRLRLLHSF